jgi:GT2 family glycosyltransferase
VINNLRPITVLNSNSLNNKSKLISVIIVTLNRKKYVIDLVSDLSKQSLIPYEVLIICQSDGDNIFDYSEINEMVSRFGFLIQYIHLDVKGPCNARNYGVNLSKGEVLVFIDDDSRVRNDFLSEICKPINELKSHVVAGAICDEMGNYESQTEYHRDVFEKSVHWYFAFTRNISMPNKFSYGFSLPAGCFAIEKSIFLKIGGFDMFFDPNGAGEDRELAIRLLFNGFSIFCNSNAKLFHLAAKFGGRNDISNSSRLLLVNSYYAILKNFGINESKRYYYTVLFEELMKLKDFGFYKTFSRVKFFLRECRKIDKLYLNFK